MFQSSKRCPATLRQLSQLSALSSRCRASAIVAYSTDRQALTRHPTVLRLCYPTRHLHLTPRARQNAAPRAEEDMLDDIEEEEEDMRSSTKFSDLAEKGLVDRALIDTVTNKMKLEIMTPVQTLTINEALTGKDVIAQAKTGTGKTIGFLLPIIQRIVEYDPSLLNTGHSFRRRSGRGSDIRAIIISPTRELAEQIAVEAEKLTQNTGILVQRAVGGTQKSFHLLRIQNIGCHILVATPGRLNDVLADPSTGVQAPKLNALVLDEADRLLDQGFFPEIQDIERALPDKAEVDRQTMLFSATVPPQIVDLAKLLMKPDLHYVRTTSENEVPTHQRVRQYLAEVSGMENVLPTLVELVNREVESRELNADKGQLPFKAIVYFPTTAEVEMAGKILSALRSEPGSPMSHLPVLNIHSRLTQGQRSAAADSFRKSKSGILVSSDVTARGMDFPKVTHVIQCGVPQDRDAYIHRLGRTGRAGLEGQGWVIVTGEEADDVVRLLGRDIPIKPNNSLEAAAVDYTQDSDGELTNSTPNTTAIFDALSRASRRVSREVLSSAYISMLNRSQKARNRAEFVRSMNKLAKLQWGMQEAPYVPSTIASRLGLAHVRELNTTERFDSRDDRGDFDRRGQMYGRGGSRDFRDSRNSRPAYGGFDSLQQAARQNRY